MGGLGSTVQLPTISAPPLLPINMHVHCRYENLVQVRCLLDGTTEDDMLQKLAYPSSRQDGTVAT